MCRLGQVSEFYYKAQLSNSRNSDTIREVKVNAKRIRYEWEVVPFRGWEVGSREGHEGVVFLTEPGRIMFFYMHM